MKRVAARAVRLVLLSLLFVGCGPRVLVTRWVEAPSRPPGCALEMWSDATTSPRPFGGPESPFVAVATISTGDGEVDEPFSPRTLRAVGPSACTLGGEALFLTNYHSDTGLMYGTQATYVVLRDRKSPR
jgi:hypothetical protein